MSQQFAGKTVAITGAAGGIGQWLCRFFGAEGATIAALDRSDKVNGLVETLGKDGITVKAAVADIASAEAVKTAFAGFGDVHLLINNAGVSRHPTLASTDPAGWEEDIAANLNGAYACAHAVLPQMVARRSGAIVNVGSVNGLSALGDPAYSAAKAGMIAMTKALAMEYGRYGIRTNCVLPGTVRTPIWDERKAKDPERAENARALVSARPHRRTGRSGPGHRLSCIRCGQRSHRRRHSRRLRADGRQHRHGTRADARGFLAPFGKAYFSLTRPLTATGNCLVRCSAFITARTAAEDLPFAAITASVRSAGCGRGTTSSPSGSGSTARRGRMEKDRPVLTCAMMVETDENDFTALAVIPLARHLSSMLRAPEHRSSMKSPSCRSCQKKRCDGRFPVLTTTT